MAIPIIPIAKIALDLVIYSGLDTIVKGVVANNVVAGSVVRNTCVKVAQFATTGVLAAAVTSYIDKQIAEQVKATTEFRKNIKAAEQPEPATA